MSEKEFYDDEIITMVSDKGVEVDFVELADIEYEGKVYLVAEPVEPLEGSDETFPLVFLIEEDGEDAKLTLEKDDDIVDAVLNEFDRLWEESSEDKE